jgi:proteasome accessory factor B
MLAPRESLHLRALARAVARRRAARIRVRDGVSGTVDRTLDVLSLAFDASRWLVATADAGEARLRILDLARVVRVRPTRRRSGAPPAGFDPAYFSLQRYLDPDAGPPVQMRVPLPEPLRVLAPALLPGARVRGAPGSRTWHVSASRLDVLDDLLDSLGLPAALHCEPPMPKPPAQRTKPKKKVEARLLDLASFILAQPEGTTRDDIATAFPDDYGGANKVSAEKMFTRDKDALKRLGYHLVAEGDRYHIDAHASAMPKLELSSEEAALIWTAAVGALRFSGHPLREDLESATRKLLAASKGLPPRAAATEEVVAEGKPSSAKWLPKIIEAWDVRRRVKLTYWRVGSDEEVDREVDVYGWASRRGEWIVVGYCHLRNAIRIFYLSRIRSVKLVGKPEAYSVPDDFYIQQWSRQQIWDYRVHPARPAAVRLRGALAKIGPQLLPGASISTNPDGTRTARLEVQNLRGLVRQALAWGPDAELVEPPEGREMAREILAGLEVASS